MRIIGDNNQAVTDSVNVVMQKNSSTPDARVSVGRVVHYLSYGTPGGEYASECRAAIVTEICGEDFDNEPGDVHCIGLAVLNPTGVFFNQHVEHDDGSGDGPRGGTWHWPERV